MTLPPLLTLSFWFQPVPPPFLPVFDRLVLVVSAACFLVGILAFVARKRGRLDKLTGRVVADAGTTLIAAGLVGLALYGLAFERVPYLSMRAFWLPLLAWAVWRGWKHYRTITVEVPKIQAAQAEREKFEKWLPKRKS